MNWKQLLIGSATAGLLAACSTSTPPAATTPVAASQSTVVAPPADTSGAAGQIDPLKDPNSPLAKRSVYFDFDSSVVKDEYKDTISAHSDYLKAHAAQKVVIQGNTDSRGSREYNLGLGQRRAESVKQAMEVLGVSDKQLEAVSFGKEKPVATGNTEADYAKNRRSDIVYDGQ
jgi:peptidoglycan-associated lipoprotein